MAGADVVERYLLLGLRLGRHIDGLVDAYYGPRELSERVAAEPLASPADLAHEAAALLEPALELADRRRARWLHAQIEGLAATAERLGERPISYTEEVRRCYGIAVELADEDAMAEAHRRLDALLPGSQTLRERYQAWDTGVEVPAAALLEAAVATAAELRSRTLALFGLPVGESAGVELVSNQPWAGFNYYLGGLRSTVVVNTDVPTAVHHLVPLVAHEIYPGHHTEHAWKESLLVRGRNFVEESLFLVGTPQCVVSEGIATQALDILSPAAEHACAARLAERGLGYDVDLAREVREATAPLRRVWPTVAHMLHEGGIDAAAAREYARRWLLEAEDRIHKTMQFVQHPVWRAYIVVYDAGRRMVERWTGDDPARFRRLLTEQFTPADLG